MKNKTGFLKRLLYVFCAVSGTLTSVFVPCGVFADSFTLPLVDYVSIFPAADEVGRKVTEYIPDISELSDISPDNWYFGYTKYLFEKGIVKGTSDITFSPDGTFTLAESAAVITRYLGLEEYAVQQKTVFDMGDDDELRTWYSGYIATLCDAGIIKDGEFGVKLGKKGISFDPLLCESPIKRYEFASLITRSFDISTDKVKAQNIYAEVNTNGNIFITGGMYDETYKYFEGAIADFSLIPEERRDDVLKAYYNGIFNGDAVGNFNPEAFLTRAEMAKVIAVVCDNSQRKRTETRTIPADSILSDEAFISDGWGEVTLDRKKGYDILTHFAANLSANGKNVEYLHPNIAPDNYYAEVILYGAGAEKARINLSEDSTGTGYSGQGVDKVLFLLRNRTDAKIEGVLEVNISSDGTRTLSNRFKSVL